MPGDNAMHWLEYAVYLAIVIALAWPVGVYLADVFEHKPTALDPVLRPIEGLLLRAFGVPRDQEMTPGAYLIDFTLFSVLGAAALLVMLLLQGRLPGGPADAYLTTPMTADLAANTAVSFATTTTWQAYGGETTLRYLTQTVGLVSQNFLAGAAGLAVGIAFIRGFARENTATLGSFWVDLVRALLWVLLPASLVGGLFLVWQGVPLNLAPYAQVHTLEGGVQVIAQGPVAALEFIKNLGTNGGGFFNANGAHPYENPTPLTGFVALLAIAVLPASLTITFGRMTGRPRAGWVLLGVMVALFVAGLAVCDLSESAPAPQLAALHVVGGNMEGKEARFGVGDSVLAALVTSNGATGSYNSMHDSYQPMGVAVLLIDMLLGELIFGGLGTGLYSMVMTALIAVFLGGLMVGRTPAYLGKKLGAGETKLVMLYALLTPAVVLALGALALTTKAGLAGLTVNSGPRGLTEVIFAYASCMANNGQTMASLNANSLFYNATTAIAMLAGRFGLAALALALAGRLAAQRRVANTAAALPSDTVTFGVLVVGVILVVGALNFVPALTLGPLLDALRR
jgi:K+-transporting ATPase ATPase A chain